MHFMPIGKTALTLYNVLMGKPTSEQALGYDLVLWVDSDGDVIATPYTDAGQGFLKRIFPEWKPEMSMIILSTPKRFFRVVPKELTIGLMSMHKQGVISTAITNTLH